MRTGGLGAVGALIALGVMVLNLAFWLSLIAGALWLLKHFGAFK